MEGLKVWVTTLISYDKFGNATVLKSFTSIAKTSGVGKAKKKVATKTKLTAESTTEKELW